MNLYTAGPIGYETADRYYKENTEYLNERFAGSYIKSFLKLKETSADKELFESKGLICRDIQEGGLFAALWALCEELEAGCIINAAALNVPQEVVEMAELSGVNPFEVSSEGAFLLACEAGPEVLKEMLPEAAFLTRIGETTKNKVRIIINGENKRFLTPPERQAKDLANIGRQ
ncbi:MAG: hypothetical protein HUJ75_08490 [Parasporobacterium sp.]|nr:hypothetical protein [Parasporobacterium sp.]